MTVEQMIAAITASIQTQSNLILLLQSQITTSLGLMTSDQLQAICTILNIDTTAAPTGSGS